MAEATCDHCQSPTGRTERSPAFGTLIFRCTERSATWI
uniref:Uncharacterized protein n=1 Tax=Micrococcus sp. V7 TaxID=404582 RepID=U5NW19_9MICC|nr:hypothetical protein LMV7_p01010 [Micrococcus sp. V7]